MMFWDKISRSILEKYGKTNVRHLSEQLREVNLLEIRAWANLNTATQLPIPVEIQATIRAEVLKEFENYDKYSEGRLTEFISGLKNINVIDTQLFDRNAARSITKTEFTRLSGYSTWRNATVAGFSHKMWMSSVDTKVRHSHAALNGVVAMINDPFVTASGAVGQFPGGFDVEFENLDCRCAIRPVLDGEVDPQTGKNVC
jgi:uncharacterized protein with gpF-like domain